MWRRGGRAHIELRAPDNELVVRLAEKELSELDGVQSVGVHPATGRVVVAFDPAEATLAELVRVVEVAEVEAGVDRVPFPTHLPDHPADVEPVVREGAALAADIAAAGLAVVGRLARTARLPVEAASIVSVVQSQPRLRGLVEARVGVGAASVPLALANAVSQGLGQGPLGLLTDATMRISLLVEHTARRALWASVEEDLCPPDGDRTPAVEATARPKPLPAGPVEQYADRSLAAGAAGLVAATAVSGDPRRGLATFLASTPKAAVQGREVFAAHLGAALADRGVLCVDSTVLRRLDRVDCLVIDGDAVPCERRPGRVVAITDEVVDSLVVARLFEPYATRREGPLTLKPLSLRSPLRRRLDVRRALRELDAETEPAHVLTRDGEPIAVVGIEEAEAHPGASRLVELAHRAGWMVAVANPSGGSGGGGIWGADLRLEHASLADAVRGLQEDDCTVAVVSADADALAVADCGIGMCGPRGVDAPWSADLLCRGGLADAALVVEAATVAHEVSRQSAAIALAGSAIAAVLGFSVATPLAGARTMSSVNISALIAQANGLRVARGLRRVSAAQHVESPPWHALTGDEVLALLASSRHGLSKRAVASHRRQTDERERSLAGAMVDELANPLTPVLMGAAAMSAAVGSPADAAIVGAVTALNAVLGGTQRWRVDRAVRAMEEQSGQFVRVRRDGETSLVPADALVPGDIVSLQSGDSVPSDCRILDAAGLEVDESTVTGESIPVAKSAEPSRSRLVAERTSMLYDGTTVASGSAEAVVVAVGADTELGRAAARAERETQPTSGVEARLSGLVAKALPLSALGGAAATVAGLARGVPVRETLHSGVSLAVAAVPEGLPLLATMAQVSAARRLAAKDVLVRNPRAIEALGRVDVLCADKTGTLTEGRITLRRVSNGRQDATLDELDEHHRYVLAVALRASPEERGDDDPLPHLTDRAVVEGAAAAGVLAGDGGHPWERRAELHFEPARGFHAVLGRNGGGYLLSVKGAPEVVLPRCDEWDDGTGAKQVDPAALATFTEHVDRLARRGYRILAVAERRATGKRDLAEDRVNRLTLLGFVALADPVRPAAAEAVRRLAEAGVRTVMMTGDHPSTAEGIASELGILDSGRVLVGPDVDDLSDDELAAALPSVTVFARVTPAQKLRLVHAYQSAGHTVAMTGDGANDAPAIRLADAGVALGEHSTSGARRAADLVVPDGRIEALLDAIVEGRAMWASVREAVAILLGGNLGETIFTVGTAAISGRPALNARQLLLVNLLTDALPAMAIAGRGPRDVSPRALLAEGPDASLGKTLDHAIFARAATTAASAAVAWVGARLTGRPARAGTVALAALVGAQLGQTLIKGGRDPWVVATSVGSAAALIGVIQTPGVSQAFGCTPLGPVGWGIAAGSTGAVLAATQAVPPLWRLLGRGRQDEDEAVAGVADVIALAARKGPVTS